MKKQNVRKLKPADKSEVGSVVKSQVKSDANQEVKSVEDPYKDIPEEYRPAPAVKDVRSGANSRKWGTVLLVIILLSAFSFMLSSCIQMFSVPDREGNVALIPIKGVIATSDGGFLDESTVLSDDVIRHIEDADEDDTIKAIVFEINSPGGGAVASEEIVRAVESVGKPTVAWIRESGTSGAYWIASAADHIICSPMSITGSVGVISSYLEFSGLMERYNVSYERLVSGEYKDAGVPFRKLGDNERFYLQDAIDMIHAMFLDDVAEKRQLSDDQISEISSAKFYIGKQALELGLVDQLGYKEDVADYLGAELNLTVEFRRFETRRTLFDTLFDVYSRRGYYAGAGFADRLSGSSAVVRT
ncbi:signal peptide peptidase SppA [Candidatus Woesearchaeota archaeon]|nr:signal peptide peptidase SppA [Candidatus Woesearchaeota archaeon]